MYVSRNTEARSRNHLYRKKAVSITYSESVFVALVIRHAMRMRHIVISGLSDSTIFFFLLHYPTTAKIFGKGYWTQNVCFDFLYNFYLKHFSF
jgi:hypothetical protein